jgi:hypothetical protein
VKPVVYPLCAALGWTAMALRARFLRHGWDPAVFMMCVCLGLTGVTFTVSTPAVAAALDRAVGVPNLAAFCIHISAVTLSFAVQVQVIHWAHDPGAAAPRVRRRLIALGAVVLVMGVLFASTWEPTREAHYLLSGSRTGGAQFLLYLGFYLAAVGVGYAVAAWMSWQYAKVCAKPWLRRGLRINAVGFALVLGYVGTRAATLVGAKLGGDPESYEFLVPVFAGLALLLTLAGMVLPNWGPRFDAVREALARRRDLRRLEPLWRAFYDVVPGIALDPPGSRRFLVGREIGLRLLRRVIEISDGRLAVAPYVPAATEPAARARATAAGLTGEELEAVVEASRIAAGLAAMARGDAASGLGPSADPAADGAATGGDGDLADEVARLVRVARAFTSSPVVAAARDLPQADSRDSHDSVAPEPVISPTRHL